LKFADVGVLTTGILGGFTPFSAFSLESIHLLKTGHISLALAYIFISVLLGIILTFLGVWLFKFTP